MRNENLDDKGQFKMRLDEEDAAEASPIPSQVDDMRIEKLNTRMTLITILIPVLIVVVLAIAYMDIKKRVIQTEDTGQLTAESLSKELESRFESVTMAQKLVEENVARLKDQSDKSVAKVQINLKKLDDKLKSSKKTMASQKEFKATSDKLYKNVTNVAQSIEELKLQLGQINQTLQPQIASLENALAANKEQMTLLEDKLSTLDTNKIDKAKMDYSLKLETLKIKQTFKAQLEELQAKLESVEKKVAKRAAPAIIKPPSAPRPTSATPTKPVPTTPKPTVTPPSAPETPSPLAPSSGKLEEQTIGK